MKIFDLNLRTSRRGTTIPARARHRLREGVGGGASLKESLILPGLAETLARMATALECNGAWSMNPIVADSGPVVIDVNPRLAEPANALAAGNDLVCAMLDVAGNAGAGAANRPSGQAHAPCKSRP